VPTAFRTLPSLQALRCFEAAARHSSFALAAEELHITQSAISHQIRALEEGAGQALFHRVGNKLTLTTGGRALAAETRRALDYLNRAFGVVDPRRDDGATFILAAQVALTEHWLLPRLPDFTATLDGASLQIVSLIDLAEDPPDHADAALLYGTGDVPGMIVENLADELVFPVCSPEFLDRHRPIDLDSLLSMPLLLHSRTTWNLWLERAGLPIVYPRSSIFFDDVALTIRSALNGQGIAMARAHLAQPYLRTGRLVRLFDLAVPGIFSYHLAWRDEASRRRWSRFRTFVMGEFRGHEGA
jgi:LysR family transcriptional regulator, glycine cleavage system transcriptional activator